jgi:hypothetical protein
MSICVNCGVELDEGLLVCPLCGKYPSNIGNEEQSVDNYPSAILHLHRKENRKHLWELSGIISFSAIAVCTIVDLLVGKKLGWSLFTDILISGAWLTLTIILFFYNRTFTLISLLLFNILIDLFLIDKITDSKAWFLPLGLPLTFALFVSAGSIAAIYKAARIRGLNIIAMALIVVSVYCIILEMSVDIFLRGIVELRWSLIAAISILPGSLVLFHYHYRLRRGNRLDSFFHV